MPAKRQVVSSVCLSRVLLLFTLLSWHERSKVEGHGRLLDPPSRASMWRFGFDTPADYDDNQGYCGGKSQLWSRFKGRCGVCGDPFEPKPRAHERGGRFYDGTPTRTYQQGDVISVVMGITANHRGWVEFRLCPYDKPDADDIEYDRNGEFLEVSQSCLDKHVLELADGSGTRFYLPKPYRVGEYSVDVRLPPGVSCEKCLFQWKWNVANSWGTDPDGTSCLGCGEQEQFYACSDVVIVSNGSDDDEYDYPFYPQITSTPSARPTLPSRPPSTFPSTRTYPPIYTTARFYPRQRPTEGGGHYPQGFPNGRGGYPWNAAGGKDFTPVWREAGSVDPEHEKTAVPSTPVITTTAFTTIPTTTTKTRKPTTVFTPTKIHPKTFFTAAPTASEKPLNREEVTTRRPSTTVFLLPGPETERESANSKPKTDSREKSRHHRPSFWKWLLHSYPLQQQPSEHSETTTTPKSSNAVAAGAKEKSTQTWWQKLLRLSKQNAWKWPANSVRASQQSSSSPLMKSSTTTIPTTPTTTTPTSTTTRKSTIVTTSITKMTSKQKTITTRVPEKSNTHSKRLSKILSLAAKLKEIVLPFQKTTTATTRKTPKTQPTAATRTRTTTTVTMPTTERPKLNRRLQEKIKNNFLLTKNRLQRQSLANSLQAKFNNATPRFPWWLHRIQMAGPAFLFNAWRTAETPAEAAPEKNDIDNGEEDPENIESVAYSGMQASNRKLSRPGWITKGNKRSRRFNQITAAASRGDKKANAIYEAPSFNKKPIQSAPSDDVHKARKLSNERRLGTVISGHPFRASARNAFVSSAREGNEIQDIAQNVDKPFVERSEDSELNPRSKGWKQNNPRSPMVPTRDRGKGSVPLQENYPNDTRDLVCSPVGKWILSRQMWRWCESNCKGGYCPSSHCMCV